MADGSRNFLNSMEDCILHFCARRYLCKPGERYHITDVSKGGMPVSAADEKRQQRYDRWHPLLNEEIKLISTAAAQIFAVGKKVAEHLQRRDVPAPFTRILHYSPQAARARNADLEGYEDQFDAFKGTISLDDVISTAEDVLNESNMPSRFRDETLVRLQRLQLTPSRKKLIFNYKIAFAPD